MPRVFDAPIFDLQSDETLARHAADQVQNILHAWCKCFSLRHAFAVMS